TDLAEIWALSIRTPITRIGMYLDNHRKRPIISSVWVLFEPARPGSATGRWIQSDDRQVSPSHFFGNSLLISLFAGNCGGAKALRKSGIFCDIGRSPHRGREPRLECAFRGRNLPAVMPYGAPEREGP